MTVAATNELGTSTRSGRKKRLCVACNSRFYLSELLRVTRSPAGELVLDSRRNLGGRGANVCPTRKCLEKAIAGRRFEKTLKASVRYPDVEEFISSARVTSLRHLATLMISCNGARLLAIGSDEVKKSLDKGDASCLMIAKDASMKRRFLDLATDVDVPVMMLDSKQFMGDLLGRRPVGVIAVTDYGFAQRLTNILDRLEALV